MRALKKMNGKECSATSTFCECGHFLCTLRIHPSFLPCLLPLFSYTFPAVCTLEHLFLCFACSNILNFSVVMRLQMLPSCRLSADASQLSQFLFFSSPESKIFCSDCGIWKLVTHVTCVSLTMTFVKIKSLTRHRPLKKEKKEEFFSLKNTAFKKSGL